MGNSRPFLRGIARGKCNMLKKLIFRVDAGNQIGFGHAMRCLSLAKHLMLSYGINVLFCSSPNDNLEQLYMERGIQYIFNRGLNEIRFMGKIRDENPGSIIFIDTLYPYTAETICNLRHGLKIIMFHNECEGMFESDFAIFPSAHLNDEIIEDHRWKNSTVKFLYGPKYIIINEQCIKLDRQCIEPSIQPYIALSTGASDPEGILIKIIEWINESDINAAVKALYGFDFCHRDVLNTLIPKLKPTIEVKEFNYADLLSADLAVSAVGVTTYELIFANIPVITIGHIKKNSIAGEILQKRYGCNFHLGMFKDLSSEQFISTIQHLWNSEEALLEIKKKQENLIDGEGICRVAEIIYKICSNNLS